MLDIGYALRQLAKSPGFTSIAEAARVDVNRALKSGARGTTPSRGHQRLRGWLMVGKFAMAMILLAGTGFFARGAMNAVTQHFGWDSETFVAGAFELPAARYPDDEAIAAFHQQAIERL